MRKRSADRSADGCAAAAQSDAQTLEVRELAELRRQRAVEAVRPHAPATARGTARYAVVSARPLIMVPKLLHMVPQYPVRVVVRT